MHTTNFVKAIMVAGMAVGIAGSVLAKDGNSILQTIKNSDAVKNIATTVELKKKGGSGGHNGGHNGGYNGGGHNGGHNGGGNPPPNCVPEPASMLAMGAGAGFLAWKRRRAAKKA